MFRRPSPDREVLVVGLMGFMAYFVAEALQLSAILAVFFCGIAMSHYTWHSLSPAAKVRACWVRACGGVGGWGGRGVGGWGGRGVCGGGVVCVWGGGMGVVYVWGGAWAAAAGQAWRCCVACVRSAAPPPRPRRLWLCSCARGRHAPPPPCHLQLVVGMAPD